MQSFQTLMAGQTILPIIQADTPEQGVDIAKAMAASGITLVEVVLRTQASIDALIAIKAQLPELVVGAGTVICQDSLNRALDAGADFIVTPAISEKLLTALNNCSVPVLPGISNTADILLAREFGYREMKLFPASLSGGAPFIQAMSSLFPDTIFCPTGGVNQQNKADYLALNNCFAVGGTWMVNKEWLINKQWSKITEACAAAL